MDLKSQVEQILEKMNSQFFDPQSNETQNQSPQKKLQEMILTLPDNLRNRVENEFLNSGPLQNLLEQDDVTEILVNGPSSIWYEKKGTLFQLEDRFLSTQTFKSFIQRVQVESGIEATIDTPYCDATWRGFRVHLITAPCSRDCALSLRRKRIETWTLKDLADMGWCNTEQMATLKRIVESKESLLVVGGTSSGKTTVLRSLMSEINDSERVVTIEDTDEIGKVGGAGAHLLSRNDPKGILRDVTLSDLVRQSLRMRPDRLILGEVRGPEAKDLLMALATGHEGSLGTLHANSAPEALLRLEMLIQLGAPQWSLHSIRRLILLALKTIVVVKRTSSGQRILEGIYKLNSLEEFGIILETHSH